MVPLKMANSRELQAASSSSSQKLGRTTLDFSKSWSIPRNTTLSNGIQIEAEYNIHEPTFNGPAYFNILLDASGSMFVVEDGQRVYQHLFRCFEDLVTSREALRPDDIICVWSFNKKTKLLCEVETKNYHRIKDHVRKEYEKELSSDRAKGTRLYDAVAHVMDEKISKTWKANKKANFFLVTFTDGQDTTGSTSLNAMMQKLYELVGRLHTYFIVVNFPADSDLYTRLAGQKEMKLIQCQNTQPSAISRAFNKVRELIKAVLVVAIMEPGAAMPDMIRLAHYGKTKEAIGEKMMSTLAQRQGSLIEACGKLTLNY